MKKLDWNRKTKIKKSGTMVDEKIGIKKQNKMIKQNYIIIAHLFSYKISFKFEYNTYLIVWGFYFVSFIIFNIYFKNFHI